VDEALATHAHVLIKGRGGYGKTTGLRRLVYETARRVLNDGDAVRAPVLVELNAFTSGYSGDLVDLIWQKLGVTGLSRQALEQYLAEGRFLVAFDGLDEVAQDRRADAVAGLRAFVDPTGRNGKNLIVVTTRSAAHDEDLPLPACEVEPLDRDGIIEIVERWSSDPSERQRFLDTLEIDHQWRWDDPRSLVNLARNPLHLSFLLSVFRENNQLPPNRGQLFRQFVEWRLRGWQGQLGKKRVYTYHDKLPLLGELAFRMMIEGSGTRISQLTSEEWFTQMRAEGRGILRELIQDGVLVEAGSEIEWFHRLVEEYMAAEHLLVLHSRGAAPVDKMGLAFTEWSNTVQMAIELCADQGVYKSLLFGFLEKDLALFMQCVDETPAAGFDSLALVSQFPERYFHAYLDAYSAIVDQYFQPIRIAFDPFRVTPAAAQAGIVGEISPTEGEWYQLVGVQAGQPRYVRRQDSEPPAEGQLPVTRLTRWSAQVEPNPFRRAVQDVRKQICGSSDSILEQQLLILPPDLLREETEAVGWTLAGEFGVAEPLNYATIADACERELVRHPRGITFIRTGQPRVTVDQPLVATLRRLHDLGFDPNMPLLPMGDARGPGVRRTADNHRWFYRSPKLIRDYLEIFFRLFLKNYAEIIDLNFPRLGRSFPGYPTADISALATVVDAPHRGPFTAELVTYAFLRGSGSVDVRVDVGSEDAAGAGAWSSYRDLLLSRPGNFGVVAQRAIESFFHDSRSAGMQVPLTGFVYSHLERGTRRILNVG
jgi:hypothetical protein